MLLIKRLSYLHDSLYDCVQGVNVVRWSQCDWHVADCAYFRVCIRMLLIPLENKHYKNNLGHNLFGTGRGFIELTISTEEEEQEN